MIPLTRLAVLIAVTAILTSTTTPHRIIGSAARADPIEINVRPVHLHPDRPSVDRVGRLRFQGGLRLSSRDRRFGGLSRMRFIGRDQILAVSDRGWWISFRIVEEQGRLVGVSQATLDPMLSARGTRITPRSERDAEALEIADGTVLVSFEGRHRLWLYPAPPAHFQAPAPVGGFASRLQIIDQHSITAGARSRDRASATPTADRKL